MSDDEPHIVQGSTMFQALRQIEAGQPIFGRTTEPDDEPVKLAQMLRTSFAKSDVEKLKPARNGQKAELLVNAFGLFGPEGPMPLHWSWWMQRRLSERWYDPETGEPVADTGFLDFCNMLQHRMIGLFYRAWADTRPEVDADRGGSGLVAQLGQAFAGQQLRDSGSGDEAIDTICLSQSTSVAVQRTWPDKLQLALESLVGGPISIREFVSNWMELPRDIQSRLGRPSGTTLGQDCVVGSRVLMRQNRIEVAIGPLDLASYRRLLPEGEKLRQLRRALSRLIGGGPDADVRLLLAADEVPAARIGQVALGYDAWLPRATSAPAGDLCIRQARQSQRWTAR